MRLPSNTRFLPPSWQCTMAPPGEYDGSISAATAMQPFAVILLYWQRVIIAADRALRPAGAAWRRHSRYWRRRREYRASRAGRGLRRRLHDWRPRAAACCRCPLQRSLGTGSCAAHTVQQYHNKLLHQPRRRKVFKKWWGKVCETPKASRGVGNFVKYSSI